MVAAEPEVLSAYSAYETDPQTAARAPSLASLAGSAAGSLYAGLYGNFAALDRGGRCGDIRSDVLASATAVNNLCPYCLINQVGGAIDHYLPRSLHAEYSVLHLNLVPICDECNRRKKDKGISTGHGFVHPYFDDFAAASFLRATATMYGAGVKFRFELSHPAGISHNEFARVSSHFAELDLARRYESAAALEMMNSITNLSELFARAGEKALIAQLRGSARGARWFLGDNYWRSCAYDALAECQAFCAGGFKEIIGSQAP